MEKLENIFSEISKSLKLLVNIERERLELEKEVIRESKKGMNEALKVRDMIIGKNDQFQSDINEMLGVPEKIDVKDINLLSDEKNVG